MTCPHASIVPYLVAPNGEVYRRCVACGEPIAPVKILTGARPSCEAMRGSLALRLAIVGSRSLHPDAGPHPAARAWVRELVATLGDDAVVVSGGARGPDRWAADDARARGLGYVTIPALWELYGKRAGHERNGWIVRSCDGLVAVWDGQSSGTADVVEQARAAGVQVRVEVFR